MSFAFLLTSFIFIFLSAAPGRTTFVLMMLASNGHIKNIFIGAATAFFIQCFISVLLGNILIYLPPSILDLCTGFLFIYFSYSFWKQSNKSMDLINSSENLTFKSVFLIVFMAEFGDVSQLAIATIAAKSHSKLVVFVLAVVAMWIITGISIIIGHNLKKFSKPFLIQKIASIAFFILGLYLIFRGMTLF